MENEQFTSLITSFGLKKTDSHTYKMFSTFFKYNKTWCQFINLYWFELVAERNFSNIPVTTVTQNRSHEGPMLFAV